MSLYFSFSVLVLSLKGHQEARYGRVSCDISKAQTEYLNFETPELKSISFYFDCARCGFECKGPPEWCKEKWSALHHFKWGQVCEVCHFGIDQFELYLRKPVQITVNLGEFGASRENLKWDWVNLNGVTWDWKGLEFDEFACEWVGLDVTGWSVMNLGDSGWNLINQDESARDCMNLKNLSETGQIWVSLESEWICAGLCESESIWGGWGKSEWILVSLKGVDEIQSRGIGAINILQYRSK